MCREHDLQRRTVEPAVKLGSKCSSASIRSKTLEPLGTGRLR
jgi:hypothetical protein